MLTPELLDLHLTYHPPTAEQAPKYAAIRAAAESVRALVEQLRPEMDYTDPAAMCERVNTATRRLAVVVDENAPDSADKAAAYRCVRLVRNALNEYIMAMAHGGLVEGLLDIARDELFKARWQANSAIACGGK